ncbi:MAG: hypothetical protein O7C59_08430 [Rickettsia endosymbiont of Ixodes persulcatus]|nr:hypothetical protein [Rickettsia endosymbiont of Ixodes persulcatus]
MPNTGIRYLLPLYPFIALFIAIFLWHLPKQGFNIVIVWLSLAVLIKYIGLIFLFYYQYHFRGDYKQVAQQVIIASQGFPLYYNDDVATGLSTTALIDNLLYPYPPLEWSLFSKGRGKDYFLISNQRNAKLGKLYKVFPIGKQGTPIYLLCHGSACNIN